MEEQAGFSFPSQAAFEAVGSALEAGQEIRLRVNGASMAPVLLPGDWVVVSSVAANLAEGQVVVIRRAGDLVTHRLVARTPGGWVTKGDALSFLDSPVRQADILGVVTAVERMGKQMPILSGDSIQRGTRLARLGRWEAALARAVLAGRPGWLRGKTWAAGLVQVCRVPFRLAAKLLSRW